MTLQEAQEQVDQWINTVGVRYYGELTNTAILMEEVGEVARLRARLYGEQSFKATASQASARDDLADALGGNVTPSMGAVAVVNQDRVRENLISCVTSGGNDEGFSAQSAPSLCQASGNFSTGGDTFTYIYISTDDAFCTAVDNHFAGIN